MTQSFMRRKVNFELSCQTMMTNTFHNVFVRFGPSWTKRTISGTCLLLPMLTMVSQRLLIPWSAKLESLHHKRREKPGLQTPGKMNKSAVLPLNQRECFLYIPKDLGIQVINSVHFDLYQCCRFKRGFLGQKPEKASLLNK